MARRTVESTIGMIDDPVEMDVGLVPVVGEALEHDAVLRTRSTNLNGPEHTGLAPNLSPAAFAAFGDTIMPARSASCASSGENGAVRLSRTVSGSTTSTLVDRGELAAAVRARHGLVALEAELDRRGVELLAVVERDAGRSLMVSALLSADHLVARARAAARC